MGHYLYKLLIEKGCNLDAMIPIVQEISKTRAYTGHELYNAIAEKKAENNLAAFVELPLEYPQGC